ncbi:acyl-CoA dehydrogenase family protein [Haloarcula litorea]|uniref:acyl-CoA dehydrogenase family protein n=1 Tax=Haloarcula litorea TaxID=3032579 RepID=UPI0023E86B9A|nr:acyl-CoA dehydrogenase family protein [Halomicroarcula sp. GDY20]
MDTAIDHAAHEEGRGGNYWHLDPTLRRELRRVLADDEFAWAESRLADFGELAATTLADNADHVDSVGLTLDTYDRYGDVANRVNYPAEHRESERLTYESGIVADAFRAPPDRDEPLPLSHFLGMLSLLSYSDPGLACPVAMTAGAALVLEKFDDGTLADYYDGLTARDHDDLVEGAMFLTERQGGSDVGATETTAEYDDDADCYRLTGEKWFCSNLDAEGTLALARRPDAPDGTEGLSLFLVPHTTRDGELNDQLYRRLKDKLGTVSVPTGEVEFRGAEASLVGEPEDGFKQMAEMLNLERLANAAAACGIIGRALLEATVHAADREAFGDTVDRYPLMRADLVDMTVDHEAATAFTFEAARLLSERERAQRAGESADDEYRLMRLLVPIAKLRTGRMAVDTTSYAMEVLGGNGYVDDFVTNRLLRDAQVLPIWEGTENVLSLDVLRALDREDAHEPLLAAIDDRLGSVDHPALADAVAAAREAESELGSALATLATADRDYAQLSAKRLAHFVFDVFTAALLLAEAQDAIDEGNGRLALVARRFVDRELADGEARGITSGDRLPLEWFEPVVRHEPVDPATLADAVPADD